MKMNDFTIDEILSRDNYSIQYRGSYSGHIIRIIRIEGAIQDEEDIAGIISFNFWENPIFGCIFFYSNIFITSTMVFWDGKDTFLEFQITLSM